jgi:hypothetical protein
MLITDELIYVTFAWFRDIVLLFPSTYCFDGCYRRVSMGFVRLPL